MQNTLSEVVGSIDWSFVLTILMVYIAVVVVYLVFMVRAVIDMSRYDVHAVFLTFAFLSLIPVPVILILGITILIIWHYHKKDILAGKRQTT